MTEIVDILENEGFRTADTHKGRVLEAARLFSDGLKGGHHAEYRLKEAFTTSDFPNLLGHAFEIEATAIFQKAEREFEAFAAPAKVKDFRPKNLVNLTGNQTFDDVNEGEEYKGDALTESKVEISAGKTGRAYGLTWELRKNGDFTDLANFPAVLGNAAVNTENQKVFGALVGKSGFNTKVFGTVDNKPLTATNLEAAVTAYAQRKAPIGGGFLKATKLVLLVPPALQFVANAIVNATELETTVDGAKVKQTNPFRGFITVVVSQRFAEENGVNPHTSWALVPAKDAEFPAAVVVRMAGEETPDIRVKRDQGERVGGGAIPYEDGSFDDDTIWFRGRHVIGAAPGYDKVGYASKGA